MKPAARVNLYYALAALLPFVIFYFPNSEARFFFSPGSLSGFSKAPWIALIILGFLGWRLNQTRIFFAAITLLGVFYVLNLPVGSSTGTLGDDIAKGASLALPISLCLIFSYREAPMWSQRSLLRLFLIICPVLIVFGLTTVSHPEFLMLMQQTAPGLDNVPFNVPQLAFIPLIVFTLMAALIKDQKIKPFMQALSFALWPVFLALESSLTRRANYYHHSFIVVLAFLCSSGILLWAIFSMYWQRVYLDELTSIPNRRALDEKLIALGTGYALVMVDIDHFKKFNDSYGHDEGDNVLRLVARHLSDASGGRAFRYGGEEFCIIFEGWSSEVAAGHADGIREALANRQFTIRLPKKIRKKTDAHDRGTLTAKSIRAKVTISMGVAVPDKRHVSPQDVIKLADEGLYEAKEKGRNCVIRKN